MDTDALFIGCVSHKVCYLYAILLYETKSEKKHLALVQMSKITLFFPEILKIKSEVI